MKQVERSQKQTACSAWRCQNERSEGSDMTESTTQVVPGSLHPRTGVVLRDAESVGDGTVREVIERSQLEGQPLGFRQGRERLANHRQLDRVANGLAGVGEGSGLIEKRMICAPRGVPCALHGHVVADVDQNSVQPCAKAPRAVLAEVIEGPESAEKGFLDSVLGFLAPKEKAPGLVVETAVVPSNQVSQSRGVSSSMGFDEQSISEVWVVGVVATGLTGWTRNEDHARRSPSLPLCAGRVCSCWHLGPIRGCHGDVSLIDNEWRGSKVRNGFAARNR
ncbi:hypothetical protein Acit_00915 [Aciditerrimonas ferrireducens]|nr:hypothetical protein [Aciditerrimonas ferrireducens]MCK4176071.1 hypothetical protein [Aciditerrimonas ferrireducens]